MKIYELMVIINGNLDEPAYKQAIEDVEKLIKAKKGTVTALDEWGKRKLAYPILKQDFGYYAVWRLSAEVASVPADLQSALKIQENVLRSLITLAPAKKKRVRIAEEKAATKADQPTQSASAKTEAAAQATIS